MKKLLAFLTITALFPLSASAQSLNIIQGTSVLNIADGAFNSTSDSTLTITGTQTRYEAGGSAHASGQFTTAPFIESESEADNLGVISNLHDALGGEHETGAGNNSEVGSSAFSSGYVDAAYNFSQTSGNTVVDGVYTLDSTTLTQGLSSGL